MRNGLEYIRSSGPAGGEERRRRGTTKRGVKDEGFRILSPSRKVRDSVIFEKKQGGGSGGVLGRGDKGRELRKKGDIGRPALKPEIELHVTTIASYIQVNVNEH